MGDQNCVHVRVIVNEREKEKLAPLRELMVILSAITSIIMHRLTYLILKHIYKIVSLWGVNVLMN